MIKWLAPGKHDIHFGNDILPCIFIVDYSKVNSNENGQKNIHKDLICDKPGVGNGLMSSGGCFNIKMLS